MTRIKAHVDTKNFIVKPSKEDIIKLSGYITKNLEEFDLKEFASLVGEQGYAFTRAVFPTGYMQRKIANFKSQQLLVLDIDEGLTYVQFMERCHRFNILPFLTYKTLRASSTLEKFRAVFLMESEILDACIADIINHMLYEIFEESDSNCAELSRLFLGGKEIISFNEHNRVAFMDITNAFHIYKKELDGKNYRRNINSFAKKRGIECYNGMLCIYDDMETKRELPERYKKYGNIIIGLADKNGDLQKKNKDGTGKGRNMADIPILQIDEDQLVANCPLLKEFKMGDISHELKFMLATNLMYIKKGRSIFFKYLRENREKWKIDWRRIKVYEYCPQCCENGGCPYLEKCETSSLYAKLSKRIRKIRKREEYISIMEAQDKLKRYLLDAMNARDQGIHLIKAQTSLGKTELYCNMASENPEKCFMFVVPTIKLQTEVCEKLKKKGVSAYKTVSTYATACEMGLEITDSIQKFYEAGYGNAVKAFVKKYMKENKLEKFEERRLKESFEVLSKLDGTSCVVITHKLFLYLPQSILNKYEVVVDEDILMTMVKDNMEVPLDMVKEAIDSTVFTEIQTAKLDVIANMPDKATMVLDGNYSSINYNRIEKYGKIYGLLNASVCVMNQRANAVHFFKATSLPNVKMTVLSATVNEKLYRDYCVGRYVDFKEVPEVKFRGELKQYTYYSMSRQCISELGEEDIIGAIKRKTGIGKDGIISFKALDNGKEIYFGKAEGFNEYAGKDIVVLGTPHNTECVYLLLGKYLGYDTSGQLSVHRIEKNGYSFPFMTYGNPNMQNLQLFFIESELEQAVGRSRLLRNKCTVYLFSNFPLRQSKIYQDNYLQCPDTKNSK